MLLLFMFFLTPIFILGFLVIFFGIIKVRLRIAIIVTATTTILYLPILFILPLPGFN